MKKALAGMVLIAACVSGCANYHQVTDPTTGRTYYTKDLKQTRDGAATLTDARSGSMVTVQNSEVKKITKEEFEAGQSGSPALAP